MKIPFAALAAAAALAAPAAHAGAYIGGSAGMTRINADCAGTTACDNNAGGGKFFGGWRFANGLGVEGLVHSFGKATATVDVGGIGVDAALRGRGAGVGIALFSPETQGFTATVRLGMAYNRSRVTAVNGSLSASINTSAAEPYVGFALGWVIAKNLSLDLALDATRYKVDTGAVNARSVGLGVTLGF